VAVITGWGAVSALGWGASDLWRGVELGQDGITEILRFPTEAFGVKIAALVASPSHCEASANGCEASDLALDYALGAAMEARRSARLENDSVAPERVALVLGTSPLGDPIRVSELTERLGDALHIKGPRITVSTACTSSTNALGLALDLLRMNAAEVIITGGVDVLVPMVFAGFHALGVLSADKCTPFGQCLGTTLGEGAGFFVIERRAAAEARGVRARAAFLGYGLSGDAYHETGPDPSGSGVARGIRSALTHAGVRPEEIDYINAHGTGTAANDAAEWRALQSVFGARVRGVPVSSIKGIIGHAQAAAGVLETLVTLLGMERQLIPQTLNGGAPRANSPTDPVAQNTPRPGAFRRAVCCNSAFGGANATVVVAAPDVDEPAREPRATPTIVVAGVGLALTYELDANDDPQRDESRSLESKSPRANLNLSALDASSRYLTTASALALEDAGVGRVSGEERNTTGLIVGINIVSSESMRCLQRSIDERGLSFLSAPAFSRTVLNASAGSCSKALSLRGPLSTVSIGRGSGLLAILCAAQLLVERDDVTLMLAGGVDEYEDPPSDAHAHSLEGAVCVALGVENAHPSDVPTVRLSGWGIAGPDDVDAAITRALEMASFSRAAVQQVLGIDRPSDDHEGAMPSARDFAMATQLVRTGRANKVMVVARGSRSASCAAVLDRGCA